MSEKGKSELLRADFSPKTVFVSPMLRARQTASIIFPDSRQHVVRDFEEMDFGEFEGRSWREMEHCPEYRQWVEGGCVGRCPGGEDMADFSARVSAAFMSVFSPDMSQPLVIVAHSGTQRAIMTHFAMPGRKYFEWSAPNGGGYILKLDENLWQSEKRLRYEGEVSYRLNTSGSQREQ